MGPRTRIRSSAALSQVRQRWVQIGPRRTPSGLRARLGDIGAQKGEPRLVRLHKCTVHAAMNSTMPYTPKMLPAATIASWPMRRATPRE